ncbi:MAG: nuclear transport factor 2 family protein [candidate division Zixibacteria bacterium]|nr:nuclear transport factor 2 family protein [candidate division Zixibacteria bacterium]
MTISPKWSLPLLLAMAAGLILLDPSWDAVTAPNDARPVPGPEEYAAVEQTINNVIGWAVTKDFDLFFRTISDDSDFVSVTPYAKVKFGIGDVIRDTGFWANPDFKAIRHELRDLKITFSRSGEVAWFYCVLDDINEWKGEPANWIDTRWTGVLEKRHGAWRVVQQHFSFARQ